MRTTNRSRRLRLAVLGSAILWIAQLPLVAQQIDSKEPQHQYAFTLAVRRAAEADFGKTTRVQGIEVFTDGSSGDAVLLAETGHLSVIAAQWFRVAERQVKEPRFLYGLHLKARSASDRTWQSSKRFGLEVYRDENNGHLIYASETGSLSVVAARWAPDSGSLRPKNPIWRSDLILKVRQAGDAAIRKIGIEVYRDENTNLLIYLSEMGQIVAVPSKWLASGEPAKELDWLYGLEIPVRKSSERDSSRKVGIEVYRDPTAATQFYLSETGSLAVVPGQLSELKGDAIRKPTWLRAIDLSVRKATEKDFTKETRRFGIEVYRDENTGHTLYLSETGELGVVAARNE